MQNGKGSKSRITCLKTYKENFDQINWGQNLDNYQIGDTVKYKNYYNPFDFDIETGIIVKIKKDYIIVNDVIETLSNRISREKIISKL